jgi:Ras-related protein Rab-1A
VDFKIRTVKVGPCEDVKKIAKLQLWDTAGQERFKAITASYYRGAHGVVLMYDCTNRESFDNCRRWLSEVNTLAGQSCLRVLVANKTDVSLMDQEVTHAEGKGYADSEGMAFMQASALKGVNVDATFQFLADEIVRQAISEGRDVGGSSDLRSGPQFKKKVIKKASDSEGSSLCGCNIM